MNLIFTHLFYQSYQVYQSSVEKSFQSISQSQVKRFHKFKSLVISQLSALRRGMRSCRQWWSDISIIRQLDSNSDPRCMSYNNYEMYCRTSSYVYQKPLKLIYLLGKSKQVSHIGVRDQAQRNNYLFNRKLNNMIYKSTSEDKNTKSKSQ